MAASLSRPDPSSPASVAEAGFSTTRRGYNQGEVRALLTSVAAELGRLQERQRQLEAELNSARAVPPSAIELDDETVADLLGEETLRVLHTAREAASEIKIRAEENAARILRDANDESNRIRQETEVETARRRYDASADAEAEVALAKQQGREMVNEARAYRERVLADLERRTTLARNQIEELVNGRDRLLQVFERARLVAVDVTSDLQAIDGPDQLVNLSPTTGPVPLMVKADRSEPSDHTDSITVDEVDDVDDEGDPDQTTELVDIVDAEALEPAENADDEAADDAADDDAADDVAADDDAEATKPTRDANVVSLFRGRLAPDDAEAADGDEADDEADDGADTEAELDEAGTTTDQTETDGDERPDVGGIFERLRGEAPNEADDDPSDDIEGLTRARSPPMIRPPMTEIADDEVVEDEAAEPTPFSRRDEQIVPLIVGGARKIKRVLADEQNGVLDTLRQNQPVTELDDLLPEIDQHLAVYVEVLADDLVGAAAAGAGELGINDTKTLRRKLAKTGALDAAHDLIRADLLRPLRDRLARAVSEGAGDNDDITKRVRSVYREWKTQHIDDQLDDIFRFAHGGGLAVSLEPGTSLTWSIDPSHPACPDCEDNSLAGAVAAGEAFPTGHAAAPAHPGCRCLTVPTAK